MKKIHLILVLLFAFVALICTSGVASAFNTKYIGNTMVDLYWTEYKNTDFSKYVLWRDNVKIATITDQRTTFYRDTELTKGKIYDYKIYIYNATGKIKDKHRAHPYRNFPTGYVYGTITRDTTWTVSNGPYYNADWGVDVRNGSTLTIERGVIIKGIIRIYEKGTLYAHGVSFCNASIEIYSSHADIKDCFLESASAHGGIYLDNSNNIKLTSFTNFGFSLGNGSSNNVISNNTGCGIGLRNANNNVITNNTLSEYWVCGINLLNSNDNDITGNTFSNNRKCMRWQGRKGIRVLSSNDNLITGNTFLNDHCGIYLSSSNNNVITDNIASNKSQATPSRTIVTAVSTCVVIQATIKSITTTSTTPTTPTTTVIIPGTSPRPEA
jgi:parallel beta-helix repeat protein